MPRLLKFRLDTVCCLALSLACCLPGCGGDSGPEMGEVGGVVTLDGRPLPSARVRFVPENGAPSLAVTDEEGRYELQYSNSTEGAVVGRHTVQISTRRATDEDEEGNEIAAVPETLPVEYNLEAAANPAMKKDVQPGWNELNFELKSGGKVMPVIAEE